VRFSRGTEERGPRWYSSSPSPVATLRLTRLRTSCYAYGSEYEDRGSLLHSLTSSDVRSVAGTGNKQLQFAFLPMRAAW